MVIHFKRNLFSFLIAAALFTSVVEGQSGFEPEPSSPSPAGEPSPYLPTLSPDSPPVPPELLAPPPAPQTSPPGDYRFRRSPPPPQPDKPVPKARESKGEGKTPIGTIVVVVVVVVVVMVVVVGVAVWRNMRTPAEGDVEQPAEESRFHAATEVSGPGTSTRTNPAPAPVNFHCYPNTTHNMALSSNSLIAVS
ncbi:proline-rich receptor-like protein kinase PERK10 isoform X2 [Nymphaea colorata]|uniref:proline-rich receptor-like protein kinase PERK10 isoform X2 n=1 Tax=Nymphaea colorata TaxID=210225 RepID=UPI00129EE7FC|nr:proline-rich receptor-like protein kinase PERK10 isoform X2 [Nymphaea colorata]